MSTIRTIPALGVMIILTAGALGAQQRPDPASLRPGGRTECAVERVIDGDTFVCRGGERVRLLLVDTPEPPQRPWGDSTSAAARRLLPAGTIARLDLDVAPRDRYGRILAHVWVASADGPLWVNHALVREGMAVVSVYPPNVSRVEALRAASDSARAERRGLWGGSGFDCLPADYRARRCG